MEVYANELSMSQEAFSDRNNITGLANTYNELRKHGFDACYMSADDYNFVAEFLGSNDSYRNILHFFYSFFHAPYENSENVMGAEEGYLRSDWRYLGENCFGLAMSYILETFSLSINADKWREIVDITRDGEIVNVRNVASSDHIKYHLDWINKKKDVELIVSDIPADKKSIHLRDDHGKDVLFSFSQKITRSPYVISIINSLEFHPHYRKFIYHISDNGIIKCVLQWSDLGYGIAIQTTGRNYRETEKIAMILENEFG